ncbi:molybdopterin converting factor subunit 1 [Porticoccus sp. W117]|uniref:molybdopterin converting factor subunit 1 n=1 Tax=Porticoccus sp. W117 TaxID=3054777 RepID=UPI002597A04F|nr:molybdopterin converting factor subunit 1 [Porticoccus sp. W117]MDM3871885.1 molybdopterin converting factor subunit 1 [Porticoccus sp. W117]
MIELKYFAALRDQLNCDGEQLTLEDVSTVAELRELLAERGGVWAQQLLDGRNLAAVNQQMATADTAVNDGDEVAFFPPVTGG